MKFSKIKSCLAHFSGISALGTPPNIHGTAISYRCAKFGAFVNLVMILTLRDLQLTTYVMRWYLHPQHLTEFPYLMLRSISAPHRRKKCEQGVKCPMLLLLSMLLLRHWMKNIFSQAKIFCSFSFPFLAPVEQFPLFCVSLPWNKGSDRRFYGPTTLENEIHGLVTSDRFYV